MCFSNRQPTHPELTTWHHDEDKLALGMSEPAAPLQLTLPRLSLSWCQLVSPECVGCLSDDAHWSSGYHYWHVCSLGGPLLSAECDKTAKLIKKKHIGNRVNYQHSEERSKTHKRLKRTLFNWTKQDKTWKFSRKSSFSKLRTTYKHRKQTTSSLCLCQFDAGMPAGTPASNWQICNTSFC